MTNKKKKSKKTKKDKPKKPKAKASPKKKPKKKSKKTKQPTEEDLRTIPNHAKFVWKHRTRKVFTHKDKKYRATDAKGAYKTVKS